MDDIVFANGNTIEIQRKNNSNLTEISQLKDLQNAMGNPCRTQEINGHKLQNKSSNPTLDSLVKLHIFQIKRSLTLDKKRHREREHS